MLLSGKGVAKWRIAESKKKTAPCANSAAGMSARNGISAPSADVSWRSRWLFASIRDRFDHAVRHQFRLWSTYRAIAVMKGKTSTVRITWWTVRICAVVVEFGSTVKAISITVVALVTATLRTSGFLNFAHGAPPFFENYSSALMKFQCSSNAR